LLQKLAYAKTLRFLNQTSAGQGDYRQWREPMFARATLEEIIELAETFRPKRKAATLIWPCVALAWVRR
jgi:hypothetical protein